MTKQFLPCLILVYAFDLIYAFGFRICFGKTLTAFDFDEKLTQSVAQKLCNITYQKTFFPFTLRLVGCFQFQFMIWKTEQNSEDPNFDFVPLLFTLLT